MTLCHPKLNCSAEPGSVGAAGCHTAYPGTSKEIKEPKSAVRVGCKGLRLAEKYY